MERNDFIDEFLENRDEVLQQLKELSEDPYVYNGDIIGEAIYSVSCDFERLTEQDIVDIGLAITGDQALELFKNYTVHEMNKQPKDEQNTFITKKFKEMTDQYPEIKPRLKSLILITESKEE